MHDTEHVIRLWIGYALKYCSILLFRLRPLYREIHHVSMTIGLDILYYHNVYISCKSTCGGIYNVIIIMIEIYMTESQRIGVDLFFRQHS